MMVGYGLALVSLAGLLGILFPAPIGPAPDTTLEITKPPFVFWWVYPWENVFGVRGILYAAIGFFGLLAVVPFVDQTPLRSLRRRPILAAAGVVLLLAILALSVYTGVAPTAKHLGM
jgi:ubiquinol-cytochrome c reductase cytochrome b subunit